MIVAAGSRGDTGTGPRPHLGRSVLRAVLVLPWAEASALQYLQSGEHQRPDWVAVVPTNGDRPSWIPRRARRHTLDEEQVAFTWCNADRAPAEE